MRRIIDADFYDAMVDAFRQFPGNINRVIEIVKKDPRSKGHCSWITAKKAWEEGWTDYDMKPIKDVFQYEELSARRMLEIERKKTEEQLLVNVSSDEALLKERAREDAILARASETKLVRESRNNAIELLKSSRLILEGFDKVAPKIKKFLEEIEIADIDVAKEVAFILWRLAIVSRSATEAGMKALQMERLLLGQPTEIIGVKDFDGDDTDALKELEEAAMAAIRVKERRERREKRRLEASSIVDSKDD